MISFYFCKIWKVFRIFLDISKVFVKKGGFPKKRRCCTWWNCITVSYFYFFSFFFTFLVLFLKINVLKVILSNLIYWHILINLRAMAMAQSQLKCSSIALIFCPFTDQNIRSLYYASDGHEWLEACHYQPSL